MLIDTVDPALKVSLEVLISMAVFVAILMGLASWFLIKDAKSRPFTGHEGMIGRIGEARDGGFVYIEGALWKAESGEPLDVGSKVEVVSVDKLLLKVKKLNK